MSRSQQLVLIEKYSFLTTSAIAREAVKRGINVIVIIPETLTADQMAGLPFSLLRISDWSTTSLEAAIRQIEQDNTVIGIGSILGFFTGSRLLGAQVSELCQARGLPCVPADALFLANNKYLMRQKLEQAELYTVPGVRVSDENSIQQAAAKIGFPLVLKPIVGLGSSFISICHSIEDMRQVFEHYIQNIANGYYAHFFARMSLKGNILILPEKCLLKH